ncbi:MAG: sigma-70 family RNA polymerase sigma factor [Pirellulales bacterium]|nr:sigma-70 family RNA polymerase sigma factor [Pirellulales bacterium]
MSRDNDRWVAELRAEEEAAITDLRSALMRNLRKSLSSYDRADDSFLEDAVQDSIIRILARLEQFEGRSRFVTWATTIAIRVAMDELRRSRWKDVSLDDVMTDAEFIPQRAIDTESTPDAQVERMSILDSMQEVIQSELTERQRTALLAEMKGMPQDELARQLGSNRNAIYKLTHDARKNLKKGLEAAGYTADDILTTFTS